MRKQGNHMVDLPQPELDTEEKCKHEYHYNIIDVHYYDEATVVFQIQCVDCEKIGYIEGDITLYDAEWENE